MNFVCINLLVIICYLLPEPEDREPPLELLEPLELLPELRDTPELLETPDDELLEPTEDDERLGLLLL